MARKRIGIWLSFVATAALGFVLGIAGVTIGEVFACLFGVLITLLALLVFILWMDKPRRVQCSDDSLLLAARERRSVAIHRSEEAE